MVMSKVSKAIAASFLCLTINVGYNVTNAMNDKDIINNCCNGFDYAPDNDPVYKGKKSGFFPNEDNEKKSKKVNDEQNKDEKDKNNQDKKDKNDQDKDGKSKNIWRCLIGLITGVGGLVVGFCFGKFVLKN